MKRVKYRKTTGGPVICEVKDEPPGIPAQDDPVEEYHAHFANQPFYNGWRWRDYTAAQIFNKFVFAVEELSDRYQRERERIIDSHQRQPRLLRTLSELRGWREPMPVTRQAIATDMISRCLLLVQWMEQNKTRQFFEGADLGDFVNKPREVARLLELRYL